LTKVAINIRADVTTGYLGRQVAKRNVGSLLKQDWRCGSKKREEKSSGEGWELHFYDFVVKRV